MIQFGNASVADIKYGSQQADKVYHGSDLVWRRDEWVEYTFPNTTNGVDIKCSSTTGDGSLGFDLKVSTPKKWAKNNAGNIWYPLGNGNGTELTLGFADGGGGTNTFYWACRLPAEWGKAKVKSVNSAIICFNRPADYLPQTMSRVSRAMTSSSFVGMTYTFTLESGVEIITSSPRFLLASGSTVTPR